VKLRPALARMRRRQNDKAQLSRRKGMPARPHNPNGVFTSACRSFLLQVPFERIALMNDLFFLCLGLLLFAVVAAYARVLARL
jgi:hypothetical protein